MNRPIVKIALVISILVLAGYTFLVNMDVKDYQEVHSICSKAVNGFPADKLAPLARSGGLTVTTQRDGITMRNQSCSCVLETKNNLVTTNHGTSCGQNSF